MRIRQFEDVEVWKESRKLVNMVYNLANKAAQLANGFIKYLRSNWLTKKGGVL